MRKIRSIAWVLGLLLLMAHVTPSLGEESSSDSLVQYLPEGAIATIETAKLAGLIERVETSGLLQEILDSPQWQAAKKQENVQKGLAGKAIAEAQLGMNLWQFAKTYLGDRIVLGIYPPSHPGAQPDGVLIVRVRDSASLVTLWDRLAPLIPLAGDKLKIGSIDGTGHKITLEDGNVIVVRDRWIVVSKVQRLLDLTLQHLGSNSATGGRVADSVAWKQMATRLGTDHEVQFFLDMKLLSTLIGHRIIPQKLDNPIVSLLLGGYLEMAARSPYIGSTFDVGQNHFRLRSAVAGDMKQIDDAHRALVVAANPAVTATVPTLSNRLNGFSLIRDFASWYKNRDQLLVASVLPGFDKFETGLATFLPGRDFGSDVLPLLGQRLTLVTAPQSFAHLNGKPGVQLPGFAVILDLAKPEEASDVLSLVFQSIVLISNLQAMQEGRQPFVLSSETYREHQVAIAKYVKRPEGRTLTIGYNFQPASARVGNQYVIATNIEMCRHLIDSLLTETNLAEVNRTSDDKSSSLDLYFDLAPSIAADMLEANAEVLIAQGLHQGKTAEQATQELKAFLKLLRQLTPLTFASNRFEESWQLELRLGWK